MKRFFIIVMSLLFAASTISAQDVKFGNVDLQSVIYLMSEMDSATTVLQKYGNDLQETFVSMQNEFQSKLNTYQQMNANWTPAVLQAKEKELQEMEQRIQQFQQSAQQEMQQKQQEMVAPIYQKANAAVGKVGKANGFTFIFDTSASNIPYINSAVCIDVTDMVKKELSIPLDKKLAPQQQQ